MVLVNTVIIQNLFYVTAAVLQLLRLIVFVMFHSWKVLESFSKYRALQGVQRIRDTWGL